MSNAKDMDAVISKNGQQVMSGLRLLLCLLQRTNGRLTGGAHDLSASLNLDIGRLTGLLFAKSHPMVCTRWHRFSAIGVSISLLSEETPRERVETVRGLIEDNAWALVGSSIMSRG